MTFIQPQTEKVCQSVGVSSITLEHCLSVEQHLEKNTLLVLQGASVVHTLYEFVPRNQGISLLEGNCQLSLFGEEGPIPEAPS